MILLETFTQDDWLQIAKESDTYGYAIIKPTEKWVPHRETFVEEETAEKVTDSNQQDSNVRTIDTPEGQFTIQSKRKARSQEIVSSLWVMATCP